MTRSELIEMLAKSKNLNMETAETIILEVFVSMSESLVAGDGIELRGFGSFQIRDYDGRTGRNPKTGNEVTVVAKKRPFFKVGKDLRDRILESGREQLHVE